MDRRSKIIVSVVGIFIVLLALVGITYAYFLTQVQGNTNDTSISITTANLRLVYEDGQNIEAINIQPGDTVYTKTFTVTNEGNTSIDYEVYLENVINNFVHEEDLLMFVTCSSNISGTTCNGYGSGSVDGTSVTFGESIYPLLNSKLIQNSIEPSSDSVDAEVHTYTLYLKFQDDNSDQSVDMGKNLQGKIQIYDPKDVVAIHGTVNIDNPVENAEYFVEIQSDPKISQIKDNNYIIYGVESGNHTLYLKYRLNGATTTVASKEITVSKGTTGSVSSDGANIVINDKTESTEVNVSVSGSTITLSGGEITSEPEEVEITLAAKIIENAKANIEGKTVYSRDPLSTPVVSASGADEKTLSEQADMYTATTGNNSYYFRGAVKDNYLEFNDMCWRIVRIEGDGSVKLALAKDGLCSSITESDTRSAQITATVEGYGGSDADDPGSKYGYSEEIILGSINVQVADYENFTGDNGLKKDLETWFDSKFKVGNELTENGLKIKNDTWCLGRKFENKYDYSGSLIVAEGMDLYEQLSVEPWKYEVGKRIENSKKASLLCENEDTFNSQIGSLTVDEISLAGSGVSGNDSHYLRENSYIYWTLSIYGTTKMWSGVSVDTIYIYFEGYLDGGSGKASNTYEDATGNNIGARPVITLDVGTKYLEGTGLIGDPYKIK